MDGGDGNGGGEGSGTLHKVSLKTTTAQLSALLSLVHLLTIWRFSSWGWWCGDGGGGGNALHKVILKPLLT